MADVLWEPSAEQIENANMTAFRRAAELCLGALVTAAE